MNVNETEFLWVQRFRPKTVDECILPESIKTTFKDFIAKGEIPNFLLAGTAGTGKTTVALALCEEIGADVIVINASLESNIDTLRTKITQFASTVSFSDGIKVVVLDEADHLNPTSTQPALRGFMEEFSKSCRFIFTCNTPSRIIEPLHSRCIVINFKIETKEVPQLQLMFMKRVMEILKLNGVSFDKMVIAQLIKKFFPDFRRTLNELQKYSSSGNIDAGILVNLSDDNYKKLFVTLKEKKFTEMRTWVAKYLSGNGQDIVDKMFYSADEYLIPNSIPQFFLTLAACQKEIPFVANHELNLTAHLTEIMGSCEFK